MSGSARCMRSASIGRAGRKGTGSGVMEWVLRSPEAWSLGAARRQPTCQQAPCRDASDSDHRAPTPPRHGRPNYGSVAGVPTGHNRAVPKIAAATVAENRELRRDALLSAAATLMQRGGSFTVAEVAKEVGLSRSAVYEYYRSAAELIADVLVDEMSAWCDVLADSARPGDDASPAHPRVDPRRPRLRGRRAPCAAARGRHRGAAPDPPRGGAVAAPGPHRAARGCAHRRGLRRPGAHGPLRLGCGRRRHRPHRERREHGG